ncbi:hypothetical protein [Streptomyces sp. NBC_01465]|uniref:hypothetical protein n=1 Tax=Streptomyces sp. NBC_01465 TaxID=2903878 RepID=UPI002E362857|nr:hypothetical protein [Streptomyces sp. NBC_01465]
MLTETAYEESPPSLPSFWPRVREFAVPPSMIETATARRCAGDWAGACAAAGIDVDLNLRCVARRYGHELATRIRADLRQLAPDLLRWHMPRIAPDGLLRPGLTIALVRYEGPSPVQLVVRTPPAWADGGQRISLALWDRSCAEPGARSHPHPHPDRRFRFDLHRHLWDAGRSGELKVRAGVGQLAADEGLLGLGSGHCAVDRWADEAGILLRSEGRTTGTVAVRVGSQHWLALDLVTGRDGTGPPALRTTAAPTDGSSAVLPVLPDAATWVLPDLELIRTGAIEADRLHPLVASVLVPDRRADGGASWTPDRAGRPRIVECRDARHRIGLVDGVLTPLDHDPVEIRREELLAALGGPPLPCLQAIDEAHRRPECLAGVRERLIHGDITGALDVVESLLGAGASLRHGALRDELQAAADRRIAHGLFRAGLAVPEPRRPRPHRSPRDQRSHPRQATFR